MEQRTHNGFIYQRAAPGQDWQLVGPVQAAGPQPITIGQPDPYKAPQAEATLEATRARTANDAARIKLDRERFEAWKQQQEANRVPRLTAVQMAEIENKRGTLSNLASGVASLRQQYRDHFKGKNPREYLPAVARPENGVFNDTSGSLSAYVAAALGLSGQQFNTPAEQQLFIGSILPKASDTDAQIENKIGRLEELLGNADRTSAKQLGIVPAGFGGGQSGNADNGPASPAPGGSYQVDPSGNRTFLTERDKAVAAEAQAAFEAGAGREQIDAIAAKYGYPPFGPELEQAIEARRQGLPASITPTPTGFEEAGPGGIILGGAAASPMGSYGMATLDMLTGGTTGEIAGLFGGDRGGAEIALDASREANPWSSMAGSLAGGALGTLGATKAIGAIPAIGARAAALGGGILPDMLYGAAYGAGSADPGDRVIGALIGAGTAGAGNVAGRGLVGGAGRVVRGVSDPLVQVMRDSGVPLTFGQMVGQNGVIGRTMRGLEDKLESVPLLGDAIRSQRQEGLEAWNRGLFREAVEPINGQIEEAVGNDAVEQAQNIISDYYDNALSGVRLEATTPFSDRVSNALALGDRIPNMGPDVKYSVDRALANFADDGVMTGRGFQAATSGLRRDSRGLARKDPLRGHDAGDALGIVLSALDDLATEQSPGVAEALARGNRAYGNLSVLEDAVLTASNQGGVFTPAQLGRASKANTRRYGGKRAAARGDMPFAESQSAAQEVLPSTVPNSGTVDRAMASWLLPAAVGGAATAGAATDYVPTEAAIPLGLLGLMYTKPGRSAVEAALLNRNDTMRQIGDTVFNNRWIGRGAVPLLLAGGEY